MAGIVFDTSIFIATFRQGDASILHLRRASRTRDGVSLPLCLSAVVLSELLIGANTRKSRKQLLETGKEFAKVNRLLVPLESDWTLAGQVLAQIGERYGYEQVGRARLTNDALIALSAARNGLTVLTKNGDDFRKINEFRQFNWEEI